MMNRNPDLSCIEVELLLAEYAAGEVPAELAGTVASHLGRCSACADELAREQELRLVLGSLPVAACPDSVADLAPQIGGGIERAPIRWRKWWPAAAGLAAAAVLLLVLLPGGGGGDLIIDDQGRAWRRTELESARADLQWAMHLTADVIDRTERDTMAEVFGRKLPRTINGSLRNVLGNVQGGQG